MLERFSDSLDQGNMSKYLRRQNGSSGNRALGSPTVIHSLAGYVNVSNFSEN